MAPHTITFLNGAEEPPLGSVDQPQNGPPVLNINPAVAAPMNANMPLTEKGVFSSGLIDPTAPGDHTFTIKIGSFTGSIPYLCELHDDSGMKGTITMVSN